MAAPADSFIPTKVLSIDHFVHCSFIFLLSLIIGILGVFSEKVEKTFFILYNSLFKV